MESSNLKKFQGQKVADANLTNVKGGGCIVGHPCPPDVFFEYIDGSGQTDDYNQWLAHTNNLVFGGTGCNSWLYRLTKTN